MDAPRLALENTPYTAKFVGGPWDGLHYAALGTKAPPVFFEMKVLAGETTQLHLYGGSIVGPDLVRYHYFGPVQNKKKVARP
jgi:hypothetical protein